MKKVAMITIGQSPRTDVMSDIAGILGADIQDIHCGALDDLSTTEIKELEPAPGEELLVSRLRDGTEVKLGHAKIVKKMNQCIQQIESKVDLICILCTGEFPELRSEKMMLKPSDLMGKIIQSVLPTGKLGVLIPHPIQKGAVEKKWERKGLEVFTQAISPYQEQDRNTIQDIAAKYRAESVDLIALDCIGYSNELSSFLKKETEIPVLLSRTILSRIVRELL